MERKRFLLRLPVALHEELRALAEQEMRSLNGQIEYLLREALRRRGRARRGQSGETTGQDLGGADAEPTSDSTDPPAD